MPDSFNQRGDFCVNIDMILSVYSKNPWSGMPFHHFVINMSKTNYFRNDSRFKYKIQSKYSQNTIDLYFQISNKQNRNQIHLKSNVLCSSYISTIKKMCECRCWKSQTPHQHDQIPLKNQQVCWKICEKIFGWCLLFITNEC